MFRKVLKETSSRDWGVQRVAGAAKAISRSDEDPPEREEERPTAQ
jgi:hypothetical protein